MHPDLVCVLNRTTANADGIRNRLTLELIPALRSQLDRLCADASVDPNWMLQRLHEGLKERYGTLAVGFARFRKKSRSPRIQLLGLCDQNGKIQVELADDFRASPDQPECALSHRSTEAWQSVESFGEWNHEAVDACFDQHRSAFLAPWLIDKPTDWLILVLSPIQAPAAHREDRGLTVSTNLLATNLLRALDARRLERANAWIDRELEEIARLQRLLQPDEAISLAGVDVRFSSKIYRYAGGDYFDVPRLTHLFDDDQRHPHYDHFGAVIADVSGHGPSAAVEAAMLDSVMRTYKEPVEAGPETVAGYLNRYMFTRRPRAAFISAFLCNYNPVTRTLSYVNCGHPPPFLLRSSGDCEPLDVPPDIPLCVVRDFEWTRYERVMEPGEALIMYTDGVTETRRSGQELGVEGLHQLIRPAETAAGILNGIQDGIRRFLNGKTATDDQTLIVIRWNDQ